MMKRHHLNLFPADSKSAGFTIIEMSIVLVLVGIIISIMATTLPTLLKAGKTKKARGILEKHDYALLGYISATGRCPCPDTDSDGLENRNTGATPADPTDDTCTRYVGDFPHATLGLTTGSDVWMRPVKYGVYQDLIRTTVATGSNPICTSLDNIIAYYDPLGGGNPTDNSVLYTSDAGGGNPTNMGFVLVSGGEKDYDTDNTDGLFDGYNEGVDMRFDTPERTEFHGTPVNQRYDDLVRVSSFTNLKGYVCVSP